MRTAVIAWLAAVLVAPVAALARDSLRGGWENFSSALTAPPAVAAVELTLRTALLATAVNAVMGTLAAFTLARCAFPGRRVLNALIDFPLAAPGMAAGAALAVLFGSPTGTRILFSPSAITGVLLFVTLPPAVRSVQPLIPAVDRREVLPSWAVFRKDLLPILLPGIVSGALLVFSRALGECGAVLLVAGNIPLKTQTAAVYILGEIESENQLGASVVSVVMIAAAFLPALAAEGWRMWRSRGNK